MTREVHKQVRRAARAGALLLALAASLLPRHAAHAEESTKKDPVGSGLGALTGAVHDAGKKVDGAAAKLEKDTAKALNKIAAPAANAPAPADLPGIHNVVAYHEGFYSGSAPEGEAAFNTLAALGVKTVIAVDAATPDVEKAKAAGLKYIHLPITYGAFDEKRKLEFVRATRDASKDGGIYVHCQHGTTRSAAVCGAVGVSLGWLTVDQAKERMKVSGTPAGFTGLWKCVDTAKPVEAAQIDKVETKFVEAQKTLGVGKSMNEIQRAYDKVKTVQKNGWKAPADKPELTGVAEIAQVSDRFHALELNPRSKQKGEEYMKLMADATKKSKALEKALAAANAPGGTLNPDELAKLMGAVSASCKDCHDKYREHD